MSIMSRIGDKSCINCAKVVQSGGEKKYLHNQVPIRGIKLKLTVHRAILEIFHVDLESESQIVCMQCSYKLATMCKFIEEFQTMRSIDSVLNQTVGKRYFCGPAAAVSSNTHTSQAFPHEFVSPPSNSSAFCLNGSRVTISTSSSSQLSSSDIVTPPFAFTDSITSSIDSFSGSTLSSNSTPTSSRSTIVDCASQPFPSTEVSTSKERNIIILEGSSNASQSESVTQPFSVTQVNCSTPLAFSRSSSTQSLTPSRFPDVGMSNHILQSAQSDVLPPLTPQTNQNAVDSELDSSGVRTPAPRGLLRTKRTCDLISNMTPKTRRYRRYIPNRRATNAFQNNVSNIIQLEVKDLRKRSCLALKASELRKDNINPKDDVLLNEMKQYTPLLYHILRKTMLPVGKRRGVQFSPAMRVVVGVILNAKNRNINVFQKSFSLMMLFGGLTGRFFTTLNRMGLAVSYKSTVRTMDALNLYYDEDLNELQKETSETLAQYQSLKDLKNQSSSSPSSSDLPSSSHSTQAPLNASELRNNSNQLEEVVPGETMHMQVEGVEPAQTSTVSLPQRRVGIRHGVASNSRKKLKFDHEIIPRNVLTVDIDWLRVAEILWGSFVTDNIDHEAKTLHKHLHAMKQEIHMTANLFVQNRIRQLLEEAMKGPLYDKATDVPFSKIIPDKDTLQMIVRDHKVMLARLIVKHVPMLRSVQNHSSIIWRIDHRFSKESATKSKVHNLGISDYSQNSVGMASVMGDLRKRCPSVNDKLFPTMVTGDGKTVDMMRAIIFNRFNSNSNDEKMDGVVPNVGPFHLMAILRQDIMNEFHGKTMGPAEEGTLPDLAVAFQHNEKIMDLKKGFYLSTRFCDFALVSHVVAAAIEKLGISNDNFNDERHDLSEVDKLKMLQEVVDHVFDLEWANVTSSLDGERICVCKEPFETGYDVINCSNIYCRFGTVFHKSCFDEFSEGQNQIETDEKWYCSNDCRKEDSDKIFFYHRSFMNAWMHQICYQDAIRVNDGERMNAYNKLHLIQFFNSGRDHCLYFRIVHMWQLMKAGLASANARFNLIFNSTANISGKSNTNIPLDLLMEHTIRYLKEMVNMQYGCVNRNAVIRRSKSHQILQDLREEWESLSNSDEDMPYEHHARYTKWAADVELAARVIVKAEGLKLVGPRIVKGFENIKYNHVTASDVDQFKDKIMKQSRTLDAAAKYRTQERASVGRKKK